MEHKKKIWLAILIALLAWGMTPGEGSAEDPAPEILLAVTKDAAVGERAELGPSSLALMASRWKAYVSHSGQRWCS